MSPNSRWVIGLNFLKRNSLFQTPDDIFKWREIGNYSVCGFKIDIKRRSFKFIFNNYIPGALFVLVSWVSFLIPPDLIPGRYLCVKFP